MRNLYLGFLTLLSIFVFAIDAHAQGGAIHGIASSQLNKPTYLINKTLDYSKDDQLHLKANFSRSLRGWTIKVAFNQDSTNQTLNITIDDFEKVSGQDNVWQNAEEVWLYGQTFRLRTLINTTSRNLTIYIEDPEIDTRQNSLEIVDYHLVMKASAYY